MATTRALNRAFKLNEEEAILARRIYAVYLEGSMPYQIAKTLPPRVSRYRQHEGLVPRMANEKYEGDVLPQIFCSELIKLQVHKEAVKTQ